MKISFAGAAGARRLHFSAGGWMMAQPEANADGERKDDGMWKLICRRFDEAIEVLGQGRDRLADRIAQAAEIIAASYRAGGGVLLFGNGGSAADAQHIAGELVGRFLFDRAPLRAQALNTDTSILTCVGNDYSFEQVFSRQVEANGRKGDVAIGLSTSGNSPNVVAALAAARKIGMKTIAFTGAGGGRCAELVDVLLDAPVASPTARVQECHVVTYHILCELVESAVCAHE